MASIHPKETLASRLAQRRKHLGISQARLAEMAGVSLPTVQRFLSGKGDAIAFSSVSRIAKALGAELSLEECEPEENILIRRARAKAKDLAALVQGTSALEAQGLSAAALNTIERNLFHDLLKGSRARLWSE